jgi:hypothetical protein
MEKKLMSEDINILRDYLEKINVFLKMIVKYENKGKLNDEGYWEMHTRIHKFLILWVTLKIYVSGFEDMLKSLLREETERKLYSVIPPQNTNFTSKEATNLLSKLNTLRQGVFNELLNKHKQNAEKYEHLVKMFTWFSKLFTGAKCNHILSSTETKL